MSKRLPVYFLHPHRGGGTTICNLAHLAGERTNIHINCNWDFRHTESINGYDLVRTAPEEDAWTCKRQSETWNRRGYTFVARESYLLATPPGATGVGLWLDDDESRPPTVPMLLCTGCLYVTVLRDPLTRVAADYCMLGHMKANASLALEEARSDRVRNGYWVGSRWSNYYTRILLGREVFRQRVLPPGALSAANRTLLAFSVVIVVERLETQIRLLQRALGWSDHVVQRWRTSPSSNHLTSAACARFNWNSELSSGYSSVNALDMALYAWWRAETERRELDAK